MSTVHYVLGWLRGVDWGGEPIKRASMACGAWFDQDVPHTEDVEETTCEKCLERMAEQTEAALKPRTYRGSLEEVNWDTDYWKDW